MVCIDVEDAVVREGSIRLINDISRTLLFCMVDDGCLQSTVRMALGNALE